MLTKIDGYNVFFETKGNGEPVILTGGFSTGHLFFEKIIPRLSEKYQTIVWDPIGLGYSDHPVNREYNAETWAKDLSELLLSLKIERAHVVGLAFGSYISVAFSKLFPEQVSSLLTYTDIYARDEWKAYPKIWDEYRSIIQKFGNRGKGAQLVARLLNTSGWEEKSIQEIVDPQVMDQTVGYGCLFADVRKYVGEIIVPWLVVMGDTDWTGKKCIPEDDPSWSFMHETNPRIKLVQIRNSHPAAYVMDQPEESCKIFLDWLEGPKDFNHSREQ